MLQQRVGRMKKKVDCMNNLIKELKSKFKLTDNATDILTVSGSAITKDLLARMAKQQRSGHLLRSKYSAALRQFSLTLNFYSAKAYQYVRNTFNLALPHPSVVQTWYRSIDGEPGFTKEAFDILQHQAVNQSPKPVLCNLTLDEMAIRKHVEWDGKQFRGYVDIGTGIQDDTLPPATEALVFMVVSLNANWKLPVGYFFLNGLNGADRANLVKQCVCRLHDLHIIVTSITCDGASSNLAMFRDLGAVMNMEDLKPWFPHPNNGEHNICILLDVCHMLKLLRNTFASQTMMDRNGKMIKWQYIEQLHKLQEREGLRAANKLRTAHIEWTRQKMKVNLATQVLSSSVANALELCLKLDLPQFKGCEATIQFIRTFDRLFDILNSRNPLAKNFKAPMRTSNQHLWQGFLTNTKVYIHSLKDSSGTPMTHTNRKTAFTGFIIAIDTVLALFQEFVVGCAERPPLLKYLLTYKLSQDHLELFFGCVRCHLGCNNNPTCRQFIAAYKRLLVQNEIKASKNANCVNIELVPILTVDSSSIQCVTSNTDDSEITICHTIQQNLSEREPIETDHDYADTPNIVTLSKYSENAVTYIAGYVARNVIKRLPCEQCAQALTSYQNDNSDSSTLLQIADRGGLKKPSWDTALICKETEKCYKRIQQQKPPTGRGFSALIVSAVTNQVLTRTTPIFEQLHEHELETEPEDNHVIQLVKRIVKEYVKIRNYHWGKKYTAAVCGPKVRKQLSKLVLFKNQ